MDDFESAVMDCRCGHRYPIQVATDLHISRMPELRQAILDGTANRFPCPGCGRINPIERPLAYTDFPRRHWITVAPTLGLSDVDGWRQLAEDSFRETMVQHTGAQVRQWAPEFTRRVVFGMAALREKLVIFDAGLDDRPVELLKLALILELGLPMLADTYLFLVEVDGRELVFEIGLPDAPDQTTPYRVPLGRYRALEQDPSSRDMLPGLWEDLVVDWRATLRGDALASTS